MQSLKLVALLACAVWFGATAYADSPVKAVPGRAPFALLNPKFNCPAFKESLSGAGPIAISVLWNTFGTDTACLRSVFETFSVPVFELHLVNGPCIRGNRCGSYEPFFRFTPKNLEAAVRRNDPAVRERFESAASAAAAAILPLLPPGTACYINPVLESNLSRSSSESVIEWIRPYFPNCKFVWNPVGAKPGNPVLGADVSEGHGLNPEFTDGRCIANTDGDSVSTVDEWVSYLNRYSSCAAVFAWTTDDNCFTGPDFVDPRERSCAGTGLSAIAGAAVSKLTGSSASK